MIGEFFARNSTGVKDHFELERLVDSNELVGVDLGEEGGWSGRFFVAERMDDEQLAEQA